MIFFIFGETVACPANYVATGACGSGNYAECDNAQQEPVEWVKNSSLQKNSLAKNSKWVKIRNSKLDFYSKIEKCEKLELLTHLKKLTNSELELGFWLKLEFE